MGVPGSTGLLRENSQVYKTSMQTVRSISDRVETQRCLIWFLMLLCQAFYITKNVRSEGMQLPSITNKDFGL